MATNPPEKPFTKIGMPKVADVVAQCELGEEARAAVKDGITVQAYLKALIDAGLFQDAVRFLAQALTRREAVWWACVAARAAMPERPDPKDQAALAAAEAWVYRPSDEGRYEAMAKAEASEFKAPAGWAAVAAFWSGGSLAPANLPAVPVPPQVIGRAVSGAVLMSAFKGPKAEHEPRLRRFLAQGADIAAGGTGKAA